MPINPLEYRDNYSATSNNTKLVHWSLMGGLLHLVQPGRDCAGPQPAQAPPRCAKCNSPPITGQCIPITVLLYNSPLLCSFNLGIKGLILICLVQHPHRGEVRCVANDFVFMLYNVVKSIRKCLRLLPSVNPK